MNTPIEKLSNCGNKPNCVCSVDDRKRFKVDPFVLAIDLTQAWPEVVKLISNMPQAKIVEQQEGYLRAEFTSRVFRFVDDFELAATADHKLLEVRSQSRVGYSDFGVNRKRVESIRKALQIISVVR